MTPTQRTLRTLREAGYTAVVVERWNPHARVRQDLWGWADILAYDQNEIIAIQVCTATDLSRRRQKLLQNPHLRTWLQHPTRRAEIWAWRCKKQRQTARRHTWHLQRHPICLSEREESEQ